MYVNSIGELNALVQTVFPFLTFLIGLGIPILADFYRKKYRRNKYGKIWVLELVNFKEITREQREVLQAFLRDFKGQFFLPNLTLKAQLSDDILSSIEKTEFYRFAGERLKDERSAVNSVSRIYGAVKGVYNTREQLNEALRQFKSDHKAYMREFNTHTNQLCHTFAKMSTALEIQDPEYKLERDPFMNSVRKNVVEKILADVSPAEQDWGTHTDVFQIQSEIIIPFIKFLSQNRTEERAVIFMEMARQINSQIRSLKVIRRQMEFTIKNVIQNLKSNEEVLSERLLRLQS